MQMLAVIDAAPIDPRIEGNPGNGSFRSEQITLVVGVSRRRGLDRLRHT
jgi:hypothetical protein